MMIKSSIDINFGYNLDCWKKYGVKIPIQIDMESAPHILICGKSGCGKSTSLFFLLKEILTKSQDVKVFFLDFKNSADFQFLEPYKHFYAADRCIEGLLEFYNEFTEARKSNVKNIPRYILIFDEYPSFFCYLKNKYDTSKDKLSKKVMGIISEILMLGRGTANGFGLIMICQVPYSHYFEESRDNFHVRINLLKPSSESKRMLFGDEDIDMSRRYSKGEGILLSDATGVQYVKFPKIDGIDEWKTNILKCLLSFEEKHKALTKKDQQHL